MQPCCKKRDTDRQNKKRAKHDLELLEPLFTEKDVDQVMAQFVMVDYGQRSAGCRWGRGLLVRCGTYSGCLRWWSCG